MITRIEGTKNGFDVSKAEEGEWNELLQKEYKDKNMKINRIIVNKYTRQFFRQGLWGILFGNSGITVNNKLRDMEVYINHKW